MYKIYKKIKANFKELELSYNIIKFKIRVKLAENRIDILRMRVKSFSALKLWKIPERNICVMKN